MTGDELPEGAREWTPSLAWYALAPASISVLSYFGVLVRDPMMSVSTLVPLLTWEMIAVAHLGLAVLMVITLVPPVPRDHVDEWERELYEG